MRILIIADPGIQVPPKGYGGIERIIADLAVEYQKKGHEVDLLASKGSHINGCKLFFHSNHGYPPSKRTVLFALLRTWLFLIKNHKNYDGIHNFGRLLYLLPIKNKYVKKLQCYQREISPKNMSYIVKSRHQNFYFSGCSKNLVERANPLGNWSFIHNCVVFKNYNLNTNLNSDFAPLVFLGRLDKIKGVHIAIEVSKKSNRKLIIAGNISNIPEEIEYFEREIKPHIDNHQIKYIGEVNDVQKNELLGNSAALLMPIQWNEPFGIVMVESMACGTPVIAFPKGSVPEVVVEGITGFIVPNIDDMIRAVDRLSIINRRDCRNYAMEQFDVPVISDKYLNIFSN
jgi:glycosyltransferase involved in cell wall biosynthesis